MTGARLVGVGATDPWTLAIAPLGFALVAIAACVAPAWPPARTDEGTE